MNKTQDICSVSTLLDCKVETSPIFIKRFGATSIFRIEVSLKRKSGVEDRFYVSYSSRLGVVVNKGDYISIEGDIRSLNKGDTSFVIEDYIFAKSITILDSEPEVYRNETCIKNAELFDFTDARKSYADDDMMVANYRIRLSRGHGRCSYFRVTSWGRDAVFLGNIHNSIRYMDITCRLQSYVSKRSNKLYLCLSAYKLNTHKEGNMDKEVCQKQNE